MALETRQAALARAEELDFRLAKEKLDQARKDTDYFRSAEAEAHLSASLKSLETIRFYQSLAGRQLIDPAEYLDILIEVRRLLAMNRIETTRSLADPDGAVAAYLAVEDEFTDIGEFEGFLKERGLLGEGPTAATPVNDLQTLAFRMTLDFRLNRYRDLARVGDILASSSLVISAAGRPSYVRVLGLIAEANLKLDYVYEAERFFRLARDVEPGDLNILLGIEKCLSRLNDEDAWWPKGRPSDTPWSRTEARGPSASRSAPGRAQDPPWSPFTSTGASFGRAPPVPGRPSSRPRRGRGRTGSRSRRSGGPSF